MDKELNQAYYEISKLFNRAERHFRKQDLKSLTAYCNKPKIGKMRWLNS